MSDETVTNEPQPIAFIKIREERPVGTFGMPPYKQFRVRSIPAGTDLPKGAVEVEGSTPVSDWERIIE